MLSPKELNFCKDVAADILGSSDNFSWILEGKYYLNCSTVGNFSIRRTASGDITVPSPWVPKSASRGFEAEPWPHVPPYRLSAPAGSVYPGTIRACRLCSAANMSRRLNVQMVTFHCHETFGGDMLSGAEHSSRTAGSTRSDRNSESFAVMTFTRPCECRTDCSLVLCAVTTACEGGGFDLSNQSPHVIRGAPLTSSLAIRPILARYPVAALALHNSGSFKSKDRQPGR
jgi:hypothetical protein